MPKTYIAKRYIVLGSSNRHFVAGQIIQSNELTEADIEQLLEDGKIFEAENLDMDEPKPAPKPKRTAKVTIE